MRLIVQLGIALVVGASAVAIVGSAGGRGAVEAQQPALVIKLAAGDRRGTGVYVMTVDAAVTKRLLPATRYTHLDIAADGRILANEGKPNTNPQIVSIDGKLRPTPVARGVGARWSPDARSYVYLRLGTFWASGLALNHDGNERTVVSNLYWDSHPSWSPDGAKLAYTGSVLRRKFVFIIDVETGATERVTQGHSPDWSPDGNSLIVIDQGAIYRVDVATRARRRLAGPRPGALRPRWSAGGEIAYMVAEHDSRWRDHGNGWGTGTDYDLWLMHNDGTHKRRVADHVLFYGWRNAT